MTAEGKLREFTPGNWRAYLDFCRGYGYVISNYTWGQYRQGRLLAQTRSRCVYLHMT